MKAKPGTYALILSSPEAGSVVIGRRGALELRPGFYVYVGSARGPGGLRARVQRHLSSSPRRHWHIDYLKQHARVVEVWYSYGPDPREHEWANALADMRDAEIPMPRFGSSDCHCLTHLFYFQQWPIRDDFTRRVRAGEPGHPRIYLLMNR